MNKQADLDRENARFFIALLRERFHGQKEDIFRKFCVLMKNHQEHEVGTEDLLGGVRALFAGNDDLVSGFICFMPRNHTDQKLSPATVQEPKTQKPHPTEKGNGSLDHGCSSPESSRKRSRRDIHRSTTQPVEERPAKKVRRLDPEKVRASVDFLNTVRSTLSDDKKYEVFIDTIISFHKERQNTNRLLEEVLPLFSGCPKLLAHMSYFTLETMKKKQRSGDRLWALEDKMYKSDMELALMQSARESVKRLIEENTGKNPMEEIDVTEYFRDGAANRLIRMKILAKEIEDLLRKPMSCGVAMRKSKDIESLLEKKQEQWQKNRAQIERKMMNGLRRQSS